MSRPETAAATFCATLVDEWTCAGVTAAFIAPGSRSTPLALALHDRADIALHLFHDERSAAFAALGFGVATGTPAVILCSSGTAGTHFHGAVVEADLSLVPLIVVTADRPPELVGVGAPQTINQTNLYGPVVRLFAQPGVPEDSLAATNDAATNDASAWRQLGADSAAAALGSMGSPGPVHLNLGFRDPLDGLPGQLPPPLPAQPTIVVDLATPAEVDSIAAMIRGRHGVVVAGAGIADPASVVALADQLGWPIIADQRSGCSDATGAIQHADLLARTPSFVAAVQPEVVLRFGEQQSSKLLNVWLANGIATVVAATPHRRCIDPDRVASIIVPERGLAAALLACDLDAQPAPVATWHAADAAAAATVAQFVVDNPRSELAVATSLLTDTPNDVAIVLSSSMPVRQVEWFAGPAGGRTVYSNRGANGIDGVIATAIGVASTGKRTVCFIGDVAFLHDASSLTALARRPIALTIVVVNNDGGGIFSHLPQSSNLSIEQFEDLFGTPHGTDLAALAAAHRLTTEPWSPDAVRSVDGVRVVIATSDRKTALRQQQVVVATATAAIAATLKVA